MQERLSLLVIEDNPVDQMAIERYLKQHSDYSYAFSSSVQTALDVLRKQKFDVIISDYNLGDGNAFDILEFLISDSKDKSDPLGENLPILDQAFIIVTGAGDEEIAVKAMKQGASDYLIKDVDLSFLAFLDITVKKSFKRIQIEKEIREKNQILNGILSNIPIIVFKVSKELKFTEIIGSGLMKFNFNSNDSFIINKNISDVFINLSPSVMKAISLTVSTKGHSTNFVGEIFHNDITGNFEIYLFYDNENRTGAIGFGIDITEKKQAEDKLNQVYLGVQDMFLQLNKQVKNFEKKT